MYDEAQYLKADGFDDAIVGTAHGMTVDEDGGPILVYDIETVSYTHLRAHET